MYLAVFCCLKGVHEMTLPIENTERMVFPGVGKYGIPAIEPETDIRIDKLEWIPFNYALTAKDRSAKGVHFYLDDYQFARVWNNPDRYVSLLQDFGAVLSPDFSMYRDHPLAVQIWNMYKRHWVAAYWQFMGVRVIPSLSWADKESFEFCFDGEPENGIVSISTVGCMDDPIAFELFLQGCKEAIRRLNPTQILWYGKPLPEMDFNATVISPYYNTVKKRCTDRRSRG